MNYFFCIYPPYIKLNVKVLLIFMLGFICTVRVLVSRIMMKREETFVGHCCPPVVECGITVSYKTAVQIFALIPTMCVGSLLIFS